MEEIDFQYEEKTFPFEIKALTDEGTFEGYAAIFNKPDAMNEIIEPGAFTKTLKEGNTRPLLWYHDPRNPVGLAELSVDEKGLKVMGTLCLEVQRALEIRALMKKKVIRGLSFGFKTLKDVWNGPKRILKEVKLYEVSPVTFQAHPKALISAVKQWDEQKPFENEHSARIKSPNLFDADTFRRKADGTIYGKLKVPATVAVIWAKFKEQNKPSDQPHPQALRFPTKSWTVAQAKKWLKDNNVKYEKFEPASKSYEGMVEYLEEIKSGKVISAANLKLINNAVMALIALLAASEPSKGTQKNGGKSLFSPVIEVLEQPKGAGKPHEHLFGSTVKTLEKSN